MKTSIQITKPITPEQMQAFERYCIYQGEKPRSNYYGHSTGFRGWFRGFLKIVREAWR